MSRTTTLAGILTAGLSVGATAGSAGPKGIFGEEEERQFGRWTLRHNGLEGGTILGVAYRPNDGEHSTHKAPRPVTPGP